jgi:hypothetical protein
MRLIDWTKLYEKYEGLWVALDGDSETVVGTGATAEQALVEAKSKGFAEAAVTYVPREIALRPPEVDAALAEALEDGRARRLSPEFQTAEDIGAWQKT